MTGGGKVVLVGRAQGCVRGPCAQPAPEARAGNVGMFGFYLQERRWTAAVKVVLLRELVTEPPVLVLGGAFRATWVGS